MPTGSRADARRITSLSPRPSVPIRRTSTSRAGSRASSSEGRSGPRRSARRTPFVESDALRFEPGLQLFANAPVAEHEPGLLVVRESQKHVAESAGAARLEREKRLFGGPRRSPSAERTRGTGRYRRPSSTSGCGDNARSSRGAAPRGARASRSDARAPRPSRGRGSGSSASSGPRTRPSGLPSRAPSGGYRISVDSDPFPFARHRPAPHALVPARAPRSAVAEDARRLRNLDFRDHAPADDRRGRRETLDAIPGAFPDGGGARPGNRARGPRGVERPRLLRPRAQPPSRRTDDRGGRRVSAHGSRAGTSCPASAPTRAAAVASIAFGVSRRGRGRQRRARPLPAAWAEAGPEGAGDAREGARARAGPGPRAGFRRLQPGLDGARGSRLHASRAALRRLPAADALPGRGEREAGRLPAEPRDGRGPDPFISSRESSRGERRFCS